MAIRATCTGAMPGGEEWANVLHFDDFVPDPVAFAALTARLIDFYEGFNLYLSDGWTFDQVSYGIAGGPSIYDDTTGLPIAGQQSGVPLPNDLAIVVTWNTGTAGRRGRGRTFLGGFAVSAVVAEIGSPGFCAIADPVVGAIATAAVELADASPALQVYSRVDVTGRDVVGGYVGNLFDTMRRRDFGLPETRTTFLV